jgi:hypothetical protein
MSTDIVEIFRQYSFLSSVLAGFAITVAIELLALGKKGQVSCSAAAMFLSTNPVFTHGRLPSCVATCLCPTLLCTARQRGYCVAQSQSCS